MALGRPAQHSESKNGAVPGNVIRAVNARSLLLVTAGVCVAGFAVPWVAITAIQKTTPAQPQTVIVPAGAQVTVLRSTTGASAGVVVVTGGGSAVAPSSGGTAPATTATTHASRPPPPGA